SVFQFWDTRTGKTVDEVARSRLVRAGMDFTVSGGVSADGKVLIVHDRDPIVTVWRRTPLKLLRRIVLAHPSWCWCVLSGDGSTLISGGQAPGDDPLNRMVQVWDVATGKERRVTVG